MKRLSISVLLISLLSCGQIKTQTNKTVDNSMELYNTFDANNHLQPLFDKTQFDTSHGWDFGWAVLEPINIAKGKEDEKLLSKRFSPGQKALYFFWYLDEEVTNGGFIQFYWNDNRTYLPPVIDGLKLIGDTSMLDLVDKADKEYLVHKDKFILQRQKDDWQPLYDSLKLFNEYDSIYYTTHDKTMKLIEKYARKYPEEFVKFK
ncbi:MAG TPA: DUF4375 domain-containing protein [Hanamia sp.]|nr:DUF4375 domain-containing protein [Hanamia sp.]